MDSIISVNNLSKRFKDITALDGLSFSVRAGEIFGIIGPDGAGKTTLLRILSGILDQDSGKASVLGFDVPRDAEALKENIGYMPQKFSLYLDLTVLENTEFFADIFGIDRKILKKRMEPLLKMTRLAQFADRLAGNLSGGMKQKLALMCTLIHRPKLLLLDEPTTGVDPVSRREFWEILQDILREGVSIIVSTPYMDEAEWCANIGLMFRGKMMVSGTPGDLKQGLSGIVIEAIPGKKGVSLTADINNVKGVLDSEIFGDKYHVVLKDKRSIAVLKRALAGRAKIRQISAGIEDVFIQKIGT